MSRKSIGSGLSDVIYRLRMGLRVGGGHWLLDRIKRELQMPTTLAGRRIYQSLRAVSTLAIGTKAESAKSVSGVPDILYAFYDLAVAPITFDFLWFLTGADLVRRRFGLPSIHVVIVPGPRDGLRREQPDYESVIGMDARRARISNVLFPACSLLPAVIGVTLASSRAWAGDLVRRSTAVFPEGYEPGLPTYPDPRPCLEAARNEGARIGMLCALPADIAAIQRWAAARHCRDRVITITLRNYGYMPARNSNMAAWTAFARHLDDRLYTPVFVPDTDQTLDGLPTELKDFPVCSEAAWNLGLRMALYEHAWLNLGVNNGPMGLCWLNERTRYLTFKMLTESVPQASSRYVASLGFEIGRSLPFALPYQKWVWEDDDLTVINREFSAMVRKINEGASVATV